VGTSRQRLSIERSSSLYYWGHVSRGYDLVGMSGKAMQVAVPPAGSALREMTRRIEKRVGPRHAMAMSCRLLATLKLT
jgi:hypothetical protein